jgi:hypothetical protein
MESVTDWRLLLGWETRSMHTSPQDRRPARPTWIRWAALVVLTALAPGCSVMLVDKAPENHQQMLYFECDSGKGWPRADLAAGIVAGVLGLTFAAASAAFAGWGESSHEEDAQLILLPLASSAIFFSSAYVGYNRTAECRTAKDALIGRIYQLHGSPPATAPYPWQPPAPAPR